MTKEEAEAWVSVVGWLEGRPAEVNVGLTGKMEVNGERSGGFWVSHKGVLMFDRRRSRTEAPHGPIPGNLQRWQLLYSLATGSSLQNERHTNEL